MSDIVLYDYWRSSAAYRVRIALNLKGIAYRAIPVNLLEGEQSAPPHQARNPLGLVPVLEVDGQQIAQSLAIVDWLEARYPEPHLLPGDPLKRAQVLGRAMTFISETHPLHNLRVVKYLRDEMGQSEAAIQGWMHRWIGAGLAAIESTAPQRGPCGGSAPDLLDVCLVPQMYSARRFGVPLDPYPRLVRIDEALREIPAFAAAAPEAVRPA
ncbi:MAG: maleylacetoacetate isomerase [Novosphingobium sp.]|uniref:maleylacetoacetate isomerase n=1 Tax=Novosphingobium sp. TaxID=1874826 RepID=UPI0032B6FBCC